MDRRAFVAAAAAGLGVSFAPAADGAPGPVVNPGTTRPPCRDIPPAGSRLRAFGATICAVTTRDEAALGGEEMMYPEYIKKVKTMPVAPRTTTEHYRRAR